MNEKKLIRNAIKCNYCGEVIESKYAHDFKFCSCGTVAVDGGLSYARRSFKNSPDDFKDLSEWEEVEEVKPVDYTIVSIPTYIKFECPYCKEEVKMAFKTEYWDSTWVDCPNCDKEVELGNHEYD